MKKPPNSGIFLPISSETGPQNSGPKANPTTKSETPSSITVSDVSNSCEVMTIVDDQIELQNVVVRVHSAISTVMNHFLLVGHLKGWSYSMSSIDRSVVVAFSGFAPFTLLVP